MEGGGAGILGPCPLTQLYGACCLASPAINPVVLVESHGYVTHSDHQPALVMRLK